MPRARASGPQPPNSPPADSHVWSEPRHVWARSSGRSEFAEFVTHADAIPASPPRLESGHTSSGSSSAFGTHAVWHGQFGTGQFGTHTGQFGTHKLGRTHKFGTHTDTQVRDTHKAHRPVRDTHDRPIRDTQTGQFGTHTGQFGINSVNSGQDASSGRTQVRDTHKANSGHTRPVGQFGTRTASSGSVQGHAEASSHGAEIVRGPVPAEFGTDTKIGHQDRTDAKIGPPRSDRRQRSGQTRSSAGPRHRRLG